MGSYRKDIRDIEDEYYDIPEFQADRFRNEAHADKLKASADKMHQQLEEDGEVYIPTGYAGHHIVVRMAKTDGHYGLTIFNAGAESEPDPKQNLLDENPKVMVAQGRRIKDSADISELIQLFLEKKIRHRHYGSYDHHGYQNVLDAIESKLEPFSPKNDYYRPGKPQGKGNCTSRSTREALHDALGEELFKQIHRYVSDPNLCDMDDIVRALESRREILSDIVAASQPDTSLFPRSVKKADTPSRYPT